MKTSIALYLFFATSLLANPCCIDDGDCCPPSEKAENAFVCDIKCESRRLYFSLDCEGKHRAMALAKEMDSKDQAVQTAAKEMAKRRHGAYPNQNTYQRQIEKRGGQEGYDDRFGS